MSQHNEKERQTDKVGVEPPRRNRGRILVIDDEEDVTFFLKEALEESGGFEVVTFNDPLVALSSFNDNNKPSAYDLILLDIKMPNMDLSYIKSFKKGLTLPALLATEPIVEVIKPRMARKPRYAL